MRNETFYDTVDYQIENLNKIFKDNEFLKKQDQTGKKSFGLLLWFLNNYLPEKELAEYEDLITEGDDDSSCDIIFQNSDQEGEEVYYVIQAKWFKLGNINKTNKIGKEIKACLSDFRLILSGKKTPSHTNEKFNTQYKKFITHKKNNCKIKFVFVTLCQSDENINEHISSFVSELVSFELLDLNILKQNFIEIHYKEIKTHNPLETPYLPKNIEAKR